MPDIFSYNSYADRCGIKVLRAIKAGAKTASEIARATGLSAGEDL